MDGKSIDYLASPRGHSVIDKPTRARIHLKSSQAIADNRRANVSEIAPRHSKATHRCARSRSDSARDRRRHLDSPKKKEKEHQAADARRQGKRDRLA